VTACNTGKAERTTLRGPLRGARVVVPRSSDDLALHEGTIVGGAIDSLMFVAIQTDEDIERWRRDAREAEERRRPPGFARFDGDPPLTLHRSPLRRAA
jgi:hypothetical protein